MTLYKSVIAFLTIANCMQSMGNCMLTLRVSFDSILQSVANNNKIIVQCTCKKLASISISLLSVATKCAT